MTYRVWNLNTERWVIDGDGRIFEFDTADQAAECKAQLDDLKQVNPQHRYDTFVIQTILT